MTRARALEVPAPTLVRWRIVVLLMSMSFMCHFNRISMSVAGNAIIKTQQFEITEVEMGTIYSALLIIYTVFMVPAGWFSDRGGGRLALIVMGFGSGLFCLLTGVAGLLAFSGAVLFSSLLAIRGLLGATMAPMYPAAGRIVSHWIPFRQRALTNGLVTGAAPVGIASTYIVFAALTDRLGWEQAFLVTGPITVTLAVLWMWYGRNDPAQHASVNSAELTLIRAGIRPEPFTQRFASSTQASSIAPARAADSTWAALLRNRSLWFLTVSYGCIGYVEYLLFYWSEYYFNQVLRFSTEWSRLASMILTLTMAVCMPLGGWLSDRLLRLAGYRGSRALVAVTGIVACGLLLIAGTVISWGPGIVACFALALGGVGIAEGPSWATAIDLGDVRGGTSAAIVNTGGNGVGLLAPLVTPLVGTWLTDSLGKEAGWAWGLRLGSLVCLLGASLWIWIDAGERRHGLPPSRGV
jgi:sugar phosphate permease